MDSYQQITELLSSIPVLTDWKKIHRLFRKAASGKPFHWSLPMLSCEAIGGEAYQALPAMLAIACSHIGIILVDDMLDSDPRGEHHRRRRYPLYRAAGIF